ncbi:hypothetical protein HFP15_38100 [Amycolatopsis sp. K13G38]|uniref:MmpS family membrane protein n=1 Tax=Amycolatopsis acididurans TaxID=2724524 RepID=A0ABX1JGD6_9PSEU|nr:MmpS family transport accessory protein [Amycolatopsis acididurans]NKQ58673.1 hypothetical protein [Amycolatopsis acididurans]
MGVVPATDHGSAQRRLGSGALVLIAGLGVVLAVGLVTGLIATNRSSAPAPASLAGTGAPVAPAPAPVVSHAVVYELSGGQAALNITYVGQDAGIAQVAQAGTPWSVALERQVAKDSTQYYSVSAQNAGSGTLNCRIVVDGVTVSEASAAAPQGMVRCSKSMS